MFSNITEETIFQQQKCSNLIEHLIYKFLFLDLYNIYIILKNMPFHIFNLLYLFSETSKSYLTFIFKKLIISPYKICFKYIYPD
jgi:hypothetical protein